MQGNAALTGPVTVVMYDPAWPRRYAAERRRILRAIGPFLVAIEHIGSTAVPGLGAKPIIDIMAAVRRLANAPECIDPLQGLGYQYVPEYEAQMPERRYLRKRLSRGQACTLHMVEHGSDFWQRHLFFRDYLRAHPETAQEYEQLKRELADRFGTDRTGYQDAKTSFIRSIEARAGQDWAGG